MKLLDDGKLDIVIYDSSDWAGEQLRWSWVAGGKFYKMFGGVEHCAGFDSWQKALEWVESVEPEKKINSLQFWGHGTPGRVWVNGDFLSARSVMPTSAHYPLLQKLKSRLTADSLVWFRSCNVFTGHEGHLFATIMTSMLGCNVAAHTYIVGPWQSGLHVAEPGKAPHWPIEEGIADDGGYKWSLPWSPNTVFCLTGKIPEGW